MPAGGRGNEERELVRVSRFISIQRANPCVHGTREWRAYEALAGKWIGVIMCNAEVKGGWIKRVRRRRYRKGPNNDGSV